MEAVVLGSDGIGTFGSYDWQSYLPEEVRDTWENLSAESRLIAWLCARKASYWDEPPDD